MIINSWLTICSPDLQLSVTMNSVLKMCDINCELCAWVEYLHWLTAGCSGWAPVHVHPAVPASVCVSRAPVAPPPSRTRSCRLTTVKRRCHELKIRIANYKNTHIHKCEMNRQKSIHRAKKTKLVVIKTLLCFKLDISVWLKLFKSRISMNFWSLKIIYFDLKVSSKRTWFKYSWNLFHISYTLQVSTKTP